MSEAKRHRRLAVGIIFTTILIDFVGFSILIPVLPGFVERLGIDAFHIGLITALYALGLVLFLPLCGWISDRVGRRPVLLVSLLGTVFSFVTLAIAETLPTVLIARFLGGFFGASIGTAKAYMTDLTDEDSRAQGMGLIGAASGVGIVLGTALGGILGGIDPALPFYATAGVAALNFVLALFALPESKAPVPARGGWRGLARALVPAPLSSWRASTDAASACTSISSSTCSSRSPWSTRCSRSSRPLASTGTRRRPGSSSRPSRSFSGRARDCSWAASRASSAGRE